MEEVVWVFVLPGPAVESFGSRRCRGPKFLFFAKPVTGGGGEFIRRAAHVVSRLAFCTYTRG